MLFPRRRFLGSSLFFLGTALTDALATPLWKWKHRLVVESAAADPEQSPVQFVDVAQLAGLNVPNVCGGIDDKRSIIETKRSGIAFFDYDNDGWLDVHGRQKSITSIGPGPRG
jgi:enediyne biosynthesis protein E4